MFWINKQRAETTKPLWNNAVKTKPAKAFFFIHSRELTVVSHQYFPPQYFFVTLYEQKTNRICIYVVANHYKKSWHEKKKIWTTKEMNFYTGEGWVKFYNYLFWPPPTYTIGIIKKIIVKQNINPLKHKKVTTKQITHLKAPLTDVIIMFRIAFGVVGCGW